MNLLHVLSLILSLFSNPQFKKKKKEYLKELTLFNYKSVMNKCITFRNECNHANLISSWPTKLRINSIL